MSSFKDFTPDRKKLRELNKFKQPQRTRKYTPPSTNKIPPIKVDPKYELLAYERFGIYAKMEKGYWAPKFIKLFPLALQTTHDNYKEFLLWLCNHKEYTFYYREYFSHPDEFVVDWWKDLGCWFFNWEHRQINPLSVAFNLNPENFRTTKWFKWLMNEHGLNSTGVPNMVKEFKKNKNYVN